MMAHLASRTHRFAGDEDGATLVEFAIVLAIFMFIFFGLIDFARLGFSNVLAEKATEKAVRMAVVRPAICDGREPAWACRGSFAGFTQRDTLQRPPRALCESQRNHLHWHA